MSSSSVFFTKRELSSLKVGDKVDHRDYLGKFTRGRIISKKGNILKIHYHNYTHSVYELQI